MSQVQFFNDLQSWQTGTKVFQTPLGRITDVVRVAEISSVSATTWPLLERSNQGGKPDLSQASITVPASSLILWMGIRIPSLTNGGSTSGLIATNGDRLKLATTMAANTRTFAAADGTSAGVVTAVASGSSFAAQVVTNGYWNNLGTAVANTSEATYELYNDNGSTGAGSGVTVASGSLGLIMVRVVYLSTATNGSGFVVPTVSQAAAKPARLPEGITNLIPNWT